ncbi:MAG: 5-deoxy-glucuronate isomerase [Actinomycetota bacterium]
MTNVPPTIPPPGEDGLRHARPIGPMREIDTAHHRRRNQEGPVKLQVKPADAGWDFISFAVIELQPGNMHTAHLADQETAIVPLSGAGTVKAGTNTYELSRDSVFTEMPHIVYTPPGTAISVTATGDAPFEFAIGSAPAEGKYPIRLFAPSEMRQELRGGGSAYRQVHHVLAAPLPAERLILYEVYVPRGTWSGWAPHRHDGRDGSPYLEEVYYFRLDQRAGFVMQRNWAPEDGFDEIFAARDGDAVLVTKGYHSSVACPSSNMMFLNYLAGELVDDERITPPCFDQEHTWIQDDWSKGEWTLPTMDAPLTGD